MFYFHCESEKGLSLKSKGNAEVRLACRGESSGYK